MIFRSSKIIPIGTILRKGVMDFTGNIRNSRGEIIGEDNLVIVAIREATREEFLNQFEELGIEINSSTLYWANQVNSKFYEIHTD